MNIQNNTKKISNIKLINKNRKKKFKKKNKKTKKVKVSNINTLDNISIKDIIKNKKEETKTDFFLDLQTI
jgi:hypothetical protein